MHKIYRFSVRIFYYSLKVFLIPIESVFPRIYMSIFLGMISAMGVRLNGRPRYISSSAKFDDFNMVSMGDRVVLSAKVILLTHDYSYTTALISSGVPVDRDVYKINEIVIGNNVFIGMGSIILPGTVIGDNTIIGAGSVVKGVVVGDAVYAGNPAKRISSMIDVKNKWFPDDGSINGYRRD